MSSGEGFRPVRPVHLSPNPGSRPVLQFYQMDFLKRNYRFLFCGAFRKLFMPGPISQLPVPGDGLRGIAGDSHVRRRRDQDEADEVNCRAGLMR